MRFALVILLLSVLRVLSAPALRESPGSDWASVSNTVYNVAVDGDTVRIPQITNEVGWGAAMLEVKKRVMLVGWHKTNTILDRVANSANRMIHFRDIPVGTNLFGLANIGIEGGQGASSGVVGVGRGNTINTNQFFRVHNVNFHNLRAGGLVIYGTAQGVVDHCSGTFGAPEAGQQFIVVGIGNTPEQAVGVAATHNYQLGTLTNWVYIEHNVGNFQFSGDSSVEFYGYARGAVRYNYWNGSIAFGVHDNDTNRSATIFEIYGNHWTNSTTQRACDIRAGWGVAYSNTWFSAGVGSTTNYFLSVYRATGNDILSYYDAKSVGGTNRIDGNLNTNTNEFGYPALDQPGWGDPTTWTATNSTQTLQGLYFWSNTHNGQPNGVSLRGCTSCDGLTAADGVSPIPSTSDLVQLNREYFLSAKPGYTQLAGTNHPYSTEAILSPASTNVASGITVNLAASAGSGVYLIYEFYSNLSGGTVNPTTGQYLAGSTTNVVDLVRVLDTHGNYAYSSISVSGGGGGGGGGTTFMSRIFKFLGF